MTNTSATPSPAASSRPPLGAATELSQMRTVMSADRTLMAWTRTSLSLLSFSFTIYKVLQGLQEAGKPIHPNAPWAAGLFLAGMGELAMAMGGIQYIGTIRDLQKYQAFPRFLRAPAIMSGLLLVVGIALLFGFEARKV